MTRQDTKMLKSGNRYDETVSALQKAIRRGLEYEALSYALDLVESGHGALVWERLMVIAVEDVGLAKPEVAVLVNSLAQAWVWMARPETNLFALAIIELCRAPKNRVADDLAYLMSLDRKDATKKVPVLPDAVDSHTARGKAQLRDEARRTGRDVFQLTCQQFYHRGARLNKPVECPDGPNWSRILVEKLACDYAAYMSPWKEWST